MATTTPFVWASLLRLRSFGTKAAHSEPCPGWVPADWKSPAPGWASSQNLLIAGLCFVTRTVGVPWFGPEASEIGGCDAVGLITTLALALIALLLVMLFKPAAPRPEKGRGAR